MDLSETESQIYNVLRRRQQNRDVPHPAVEIMFCGIQGSGKTTLAQRLARDLQAQYIQNDAAREFARQNGIKEFKPHNVTHALAHAIFTEDANKLIVLDASVDRTWRHALTFCQEQGATPFVIRINIHPEKALARLQKRGRADDPQLITLIPEHVEYFEACKKELPADIELTVPFDYQEALDAVRQKLTRL